ncbi:MAG: histidine--tRNA ligase [Candidatus Staskawiczbacteria bacterium RIFOXYC1_FULL_37_43]|nr:MAG: histidine--tRNA ligase [Candidatus Staskawiczbacteria bacterium RIFCSPHIGHO2_01_FULL_37_17]OGZ71764.1 MAG: histidine--tRNA ligase [Candidatus Staskawiczbacteria bacterium RIFCSPLOWO2_01_FULL_37_19]OGZ75867.1 MAG: histidine--tRNA ligase [Candidatus Staskawiczbacteria bacterium RIFOXYA1_FULL_37_15]OGZ80237.1 MAG: histidine--tRNA ligase [Candidatus Staskawiczbacteria bacterium RIFOXYB1_FULL_38_37]OGZ81840.1 MAG: histidine--tRNA ligase [Candidatus Staskawiczbacteria bacterium RIFOXYB2_FULL_
MHDVLPDDQLYIKKIDKAVEGVANYYGFSKIETPIVEQAELFSKGVGADTDIIGKEMYTFRTKGADFVCLRPEGTAGIMRSYIEHGMHNLPQPVKLWYLGPFFRYEKPQAGRFRQFHQFGFEALGEKTPSIDCQIIQMSYDVLKELSIKNITIEVNSIGDSECRPYFKKILTGYLRSRKSSLCSDCQRRLKENPLRILDCKEEKCQRVKAGAPQIIDHLCEDCHTHFKQVLEFLDELELPYTLNPYLVRGLDYYTKTVFEIVEQAEDGQSNGSLIGGGRYDNLAKILGGRDTPSCGSAGGIERILSLMKNKEIKTKKSKDEPQIFLAQLGQLAKRKSMKLFEEFRAAKIPMAESFSKDSLKTQLRTADKMGIRWVLIFGQKEALEDFITLRDMDSGVQKEIKLDKVVQEMKTKVKK